MPKILKRFLNSENIFTLQKEGEAILENPNQPSQGPWHNTVDQNQRKKEYHKILVLRICCNMKTNIKQHNQQYSSQHEAKTEEEIFYAVASISHDDIQ